MAELLELAHLINEHRMAQVQIRRGRIKTRLDAQRAALARRSASSSSTSNSVGTPTDFVELLRQRSHRGGPGP